MSDRIFDNNQAIVEGEIISDFEFSHEMFGEGFYMVKLRVSRLSVSADIIPLLISERLIDVRESHLGRFVEVRGQFRSFNERGEDGNHLILSLFVKDLVFLDELNDCNPNSIFLDGYICKGPVYRTTPLGREIADILLAVNRAYSKSDYIPCICWGRNARYAGSLPVGSRVQLWGRIQSREYIKKVEDNSIVSRVAYEISVNTMECFEDMLPIQSRVAESGNGYMEC
ncbi:MAG: single-stranded DNA-binding protein [Eubacteriales bacterium]|nr:single-stranded DNA-binding protein [Eubacteriales bacterium]